MNKNHYQKTKNIEKIKRIIKEGEEIFTVSEELDIKCLETNKIDNWAESFYNVKKGLFRKRYIELMSRTENKKFFEALNYEYGINGYPVDLNKAYLIYKKAAETTNDTLSMFRLYRIYMNEYKKFNLPKRNIILEKYYLFKCCTFLTTQEFCGSSYLYKRFDVLRELSILINNNERGDFMVLFDKYFKHLKRNYKVYNLDLKEIILISSIIKWSISDDQKEKENSYSQVLSLSKDNNLEATYKLISLNDDNSKNISNDRIYRLLYLNKYYRSYLDYALYLYDSNEKQKALDILKIALNNGYYYVILHYFDIFFEINDFEDIMKSPLKKKEFLFIVGCTMDYLIADGIYSFYEFIYIRTVCIKHFGFKNEFNEYFNDYTKEIVDYLIEITDGSEEENKTKIKLYYKNDDYYSELYFVCGILYYYGVEGVLDKNYSKSLKKIEISLNNSSSYSYKRFCYTYIFKIKEKMSKMAKGENTQNEDETNKELEEIKNKLFKMYYNGISSEIKNLSSSYFYYLSNLYNKKIGNNGDILLEYIFMNRAVNSKGGGDIGFNSFIIYYRKYKAKLKMKGKNKEEFYEKLKNIQGYMSVEGYGEDGMICPICYDKKKSTLCLPCKHLFCDKCLDKLENKNKCPICRTIIIMTFDLKSKKEKVI